VGSPPDLRRHWAVRSAPPLLLRRLRMTPFKLRSTSASASTEPPSLTCWFCGYCIERPHVYLRTVPPFHVSSVHGQLSFSSLCVGLLRVGVTRDRRRLLPLAKAVTPRSSSWAPLFGSDRVFRTRATDLRGSTAACGGVGRQPPGKTSERSEGLALRAEPA